MRAIETAALTKYYGRARGIIDVNLQVEEGEIFGFVGPNGAGKSTTIRTLLNFIFPSSGSARIFGLDVCRDSVRIRKMVGYLGGETGYYDDLTVEGLLRYMASFHGAAFSAGIRELAEVFEIELQKKIYSLSLGNKRKVGLIQALLHRPRLLILDEPTGGLDPLMQRRLFEVLQEENSRGTTVFFSSHILSEVQRLCHRVAIIKEGRVIRVEEIDRLRRDQFTNVRITFQQGAVPRLELPGITHQQEVNGALHLFFNGDVNELLRLLVRYPIDELRMEEPSLEEIFMHYYEKEGAV